MPTDHRRLVDPSAHNSNRYGLTLRPTLLAGLLLAALMNAVAPIASGQMTTWDKRHRIDTIALTIVYFVPKDREPLDDWRQRVDYFAGRIEAFHEREFQSQSKIKINVRDEPFRSKRTVAELREGDGDAIFFRTFREVDPAIKFAEGVDDDDPYPILLILSEINWRPLDDFYRLQPTANGPKFEGHLIGGYHFPGAASGGARATYLRDQRKGWGLVSSDGWRVPYAGSDCVAYHEGVGHTIGLPHPQPGNGSVMSLGQYRGWINESWLDVDQKRRLGWTGDPEEVIRDDLFSVFTAKPAPAIPRPGQEVALQLRWPEQARLKSLRVRVQTSLPGPWREAVAIHRDAGSPAVQAPPATVSLGTFPEPTPVSYRVDATLQDGQTVELWGYFQVRARPDVTPLPDPLPIELSDPQPPLK